MKKRCMTCGQESDHGFCEKHRDPSAFPPPAPKSPPRAKADGHGCILRYDDKGGIRCASNQIPVSHTRRPTYAGQVVGKAANGEPIRELGKGLVTVGGAKVIDSPDARRAWNDWERKHE